MPQEPNRDESGEEDMGCEISLIRMGLLETDFCFSSPTMEVPIFLPVHERDP